MSWLNVLWLVLFLGKVETRQKAVLDFLLCLIQVQRETIRSLNIGRDKRLTDWQRRRLAILARAVPNDFLQNIAALSYSPDTFLRWYRRLVHQKYRPEPRRRQGRPAISPETVALVGRLAEDNPSWGYRRIVGALKHLGVTLSKNTVARILEDAGLSPAPKRTRSWRCFLEQQWSSMVAADFFTVELTRGWGDSAGACFGHDALGNAKNPHCRHCERADAGMAGSNRTQRNGRGTWLLERGLVFDS
ncbi:helix-turn-helix domain-containing protein [Acanthopleuribacter pedis]|uniref:Helix-turn-helix domain-containing protein n=1 Tax=Acanthopleuribacter pedis TaxID=442870 RepID=A0A8J7QS69_9BACT|nr:helix-turn-helix domain-containing protein [Acanthopleuribacter pedis]MBO1323480.1 helix-turn-helix domain-containing protein [Acanthopleuribacter pedis]